MNAQNILTDLEQTLELNEQWDDYYNKVYGEWREIYEDDWVFNDSKYFGQGIPDQYNEDHQGAD